MNLPKWIVGTSAAQDGVPVAELKSPGCRVAVAILFAIAASQTTAATRDLDGDKRDDVVWRHATIGSNVNWRSGDPARAIALIPVRDLRWNIVGIGDFDGDGSADLLWRHSATGGNTIWRSGSGATQQRVAAVADTRWQVIGIGDFDGDRRSDVLWRHPTLGYAIWPAANASASRAVRGPQFVAIADLDGDRRDDLVWRTGVYPPSGLHFFAWSAADEMHTFDLGIVSTYEMANWQLQAVGDFDGDRRADLFWRNMRDGRNVAWRGGSPAASMPIVRVNDPAWRVAATGDYDGDGRSDLFWRHTVGGNTSVWPAANASQGRALARPSTLWVVVP